MAEDKKVVLIYTDWICVFNELNDAEAGKLIKHLFEYVNDQNPEPPDRLTKLLFEPIKQQLKRDLRKWETTRVQRIETGRLGGIKSGEARKAKALQDEANEANASIAKETEANEPVTVTVTVTDTDTEKEVILSKDKKATSDFVDQIIEQFVLAHKDYTVVNKGMERSAAGKVLNIYKKKYPGANSEETLIGLRAYFDQCVNINDDWLKTNMSLPMIISKFNQINKILKNGGLKRTGTTSQELAGIIANNFSADSKE